jgi:hypothetical protein
VTHRSPAPVAIASLTSERTFMEQVTQLAELRGFSWCHWRPARTAHGWRTAGSGPLSKGHPDLLLVRPRDRRLIYAELKSATGKLDADQREVLDVLRQVGECHVWRPQDWPLIEATLR